MGITKAFFYSGRPSGAEVLSSLRNLKVVGSNPGGAPVPLDVSSSVPLLGEQRPWCVVPCLRDIAHERSLAIFRNEKSSDPGGGFLLSSYSFDHQRLNKLPTFLSP